MTGTRDYRAEVREAAGRVQRALAQRGFEHKGRPVAFKDLVLERRPWGRTALLVVDTNRLPRGVSVPRLCSDDVVHHLQAVVGRAMEVENTTGLAYRVYLDPRPRPDPLPRRVALDLDGRRAGRFLVPVGVGRAGPVWRPLARLDAVLVAGTRRMGKSTWVNAALAALTAAHGPEDLRLFLSDPKEVELAAWEGAPHLAGAVARDLATTDRMLRGLMAEMDARVALFRAALARNLDEYNARADAPLPALLLVMDEVADLANEAGGLGHGTMRALTRAVAKGGAFGLHALLATQLPDSDTMARFLKANIATRLSFWLPSDANYRTALNPSAGERFPRPDRVPGRMVARLDDGWHELQAYEAPPGPTAASPLSEAERAMVAGCDGWLRIEDFQNHLQLTEWKARKLAAAWEARGWLEKDPAACNARRVRGGLRRIAGLAV